MVPTGGPQDPKPSPRTDASRIGRYSQANQEGFKSNAFFYRSCFNHSQTCLGSWGCLNGTLGEGLNRGREGYGRLTSRRWLARCRRCSLAFVCCRTQTPCFLSSLSESAILVMASLPEEAYLLRSGRGPMPVTRRRKRRRRRRWSRGGRAQTRLFCRSLGVLIPKLFSRTDETNARASTPRSRRDGRTCHPSL